MPASSSGSKSSAMIPKYRIIPGEDNQLRVAYCNPFIGVTLQGLAIDEDGFMNNAKMSLPYYPSSGELSPQTFIIESDKIDAKSGLLALPPGEHKFQINQEKSTPKYVVYSSKDCEIWIPRNFHDKDLEDSQKKDAELSWCTDEAGIFGSDTPFTGFVFKYPNGTNIAFGPMRIGQLETLDGYVKSQCKQETNSPPIINGTYYAKIGDLNCWIDFNTSPPVVILDKTSGNPVATTVLTSFDPNKFQIQIAPPSWQECQDVMLSSDASGTEGTKKEPKQTVEDLENQVSELEKKLAAETAT
ncbi:MAG: hypothetical protein EBU93_07915, partial [Chlamydiae bacterium]|nr:hypothetical protein [Chlamydiota bacterium]